MEPESKTAIKTGSRRRSRLVLVGLFAVFVGPIFVAWLYTSGFLQLDEVRTNHGILFQPAIDLRGVDPLTELFERADMAPGEWLTLVISSGSCADRCVKTISRLLTIRSLLGYAGQRVAVLGLSEDAPNENPAAGIAPTRILHDAVSYAAIRDLIHQAEPGTAFPQVLFLDWRKQLVLRFPAEAASGDIKKDLKRLLRASKIR